MSSQQTRTEHDSMGPVEVPAGAYWGAQTQRAVDNFDISPYRLPNPLKRALAELKRAAALANQTLGILDEERAQAIAAAADDVIAGKLDDAFPIDVFQTGSGTSWNMNMNEVLANRANERLGQPLGTRTPVHPNDHVNRGQSSNDVIPSSLDIAVRMELPALIEAAGRLADAFDAKAKAYADALRLGRTHLQDAVPMTFGHTFGAYGAQVRDCRDRLQACLADFEGLALGGTAIGTGLNTHPKFAETAIERIADRLQIPFCPAENRFVKISSRDNHVQLLGTVATLAGALLKIGNDLRLLASGPRAGLAELELPALQPGSSIMPGKVNPVIPEMVIQTAAHLLGKHTSVATAGQNAPLELNIMLPLIAYEGLSALALATQCLDALRTRCVEDLRVNAPRAQAWIEESLALVTPLALAIGYDEAAKLAHHAHETGKTIRQVLEADSRFESAQVERLLDPRQMLGPRAPEENTD